MDYIKELMKKNRCYKFLIFLVGIIFLFHGSLFASLKFEHFSNKEGFNQNTIYAIVEDKYGFLWFGTPNGLIKYDGYDFYKYTHDPTNENCISNNYIKCLFTDDDGVIWIGTREGVNVYIPSLEKFLAVPLDRKVFISQIAADTKGEIWISGDNSLFTCKLVNSGSDFSFEVSDNILKAESSLSIINNFCFVNENMILFSRLYGLFQLEPENSSSASAKNPTIRSVHAYSTLANSEVKVIYKMDNIFWIGTSSGLYKTVLDGDRIRIMQKFEVTTWDMRLITDLNVLTIFQDKQGNMWIGSADEGIFKFNTKTENFENFGYNPKDKTGISSSRINCFYQDRFDVMWIGTAQGGVNKLDIRQKQFLSYSNNPYDDESISDNLITNILEDSKGILWIATYNESVCRSKPVKDTDIGHIRFERLKNQMPLEKQDIVLFIYEDKKGFIWFGTFNSVVVYNPVNNTFKKIKLMKEGRTVPLSSCRAIYQIDQNNILLGGNDIVVVHNPWSNIKNQKNPVLEVNAVSTEFNAVQAFLKNRNGSFWVGTVNGLFRCDYKENRFKIIQHYSTDQATDLRLSHNNIFSLHEDNDGNIWVGTFAGGLNKLVVNQSGEPTKIEYFSKSGLLPDDAIYGILQEDNEHLWISTDMGLCRLNTKENKIDLFDVRDGLPNNNFRQSAYFKGKSGYFYFGGLNGLTIFNPETITLNNILPNSRITGISINNNRIKIGEKFHRKIILQKSAMETNGITISHHARILTFYLVAQHSAVPLKNKLAYMLDGFNNEWFDAEGGKSSITFTNLPVGEYILRVKSANCDGLWNNETTDLNIAILPPWYQTWCSYIIFLLIIISIIAGVLVYFIRLEKLKQRLKYEQIDKQRIDTINQSRLQFFTNISHEFRTPLTLIAGPLEQVINKNKDKENTKYLTTIQNNTRRLLNLVDQLITFRQAEQGHLNLNLSTDTLGNFIYPAAEAFEGYAIQKSVNFFYKINSPNEEVVIDVEKTERIIFNLISNSFRHTPPHGNISIETDIVTVSNKKMISIKVIDTGKGIPIEKQGKIFDMYYQLEGRKGNVGGTGIGLTFCKSLIELMGGTISVESEPNIRTCFTVLMPSKTIEENNRERTGAQESLIKDWIPTQVPLIAESLNSSDSYPKANSLLIVEDEKDVRDFLMDALGEKYSIVFAENGMDALNKIKQNEPDLVISDVMMPEMDGLDLCEEIKSNPETYHIPVILLTALGEKESVIEGLECRADDYISKPFSLKHLEISVERLIENNHRLKEYFSKNSRIPDTGIEISTRNKIFLTQVIDAIENNLSDSNFGVEELAAEIRLSPSQFYRRLKQLTGQIPNVYLRNYRLQRAAELLTKNEGLNVAEVMYQIGIESHSYFSTSFKKLHGVAPSDFVRKNKARFEKGKIESYK